MDRNEVSSVSVVVPVLDQAEELALQLEALAGQDCPIPFEVLVADNGSTDDTPAVIERWSRTDKRVRGVDASLRRGPGAARNEASRWANGDAVAFCDADDVVRSGWLAALVAALEDADLVAGAFDFGALNGGRAGEVVAEYTSHFGFLPAGLGANLAIRRGVFEALGGFAEDLLVGEDIELCWRAQLAGHRFAVVPQAVVAKRERTSPVRRRAQLVGYGRNEAALYRRFRAHGMTRNPGLTVKTYAWLMINAPRALVNARCRDRWTRAFYVRWGRLRGSAEHHVIFP